MTCKFNIKCPHCDNEGIGGYDGDDDILEKFSENDVPISVSSSITNFNRRGELIYAHCKVCGKDHLRNTYCNTAYCTKVEHTYDAELRAEALKQIEEESKWTREQRAEALKQIVRGVKRADINVEELE